jgi:small subunit ribosomal protein S4e
MGKRGGTKHLKRYAAPKLYKIPRKERKFITRPLPGKKDAMALSTALRKFYETSKEIKKILNSRTVRVDGKIVTDPKFPVALMDVISIGDKNYRVLIDKYGKYEIEECNDPTTKICRVENKTRSKKNKIILTLHDGRNVEYDANVFDSLVISIPDRKIIEKISLKPNSKCLITGGKWIGYKGIIKEIDEKTKNVTINADGIEITTHKKYIFPIK